MDNSVSIHSTFKQILVKAVILNTFHQRNKFIFKVLTHCILRALKILPELKAAQHKHRTLENPGVILGIQPLKNQSMFLSKNTGQNNPYTE